jgi:hypothetical protein
MTSTTIVGIALLFHLTTPRGYRRRCSAADVFEGFSRSPELARDRTVICPDLRGDGGAARERLPHCHARYAF